MSFFSYSCFLFLLFSEAGRWCCSSQVAGKQGNSFAWPNPSTISFSFFLLVSYPVFYHRWCHGKYPATDTDTSCIRASNHYTKNINLI
ncbi:hypothetical protein CGRA01v4_13030 [Colletotrichum graminicola]|nr:hypothetical protein CGRA01v4_13030 [Colletotrichum graminicola]